jgi:VanZ family protein
VKNKKQVITAVLILLIIATAAFIWSNSFASGIDSNKVSDSVMNKIKPVIDPQNKIPEDIFSYFIRKTAHFSEFMLLGFELILTRIIIKKPGIFTMLFCALSVAVTDESIQIFTGRTDSVKDILLDFTGAVFGMAVIYIIYSAVTYMKKHADK